jgi:hypothetical protein
MNTGKETRPYMETDERKIESNLAAVMDKTIR